MCAFDRFMHAYTVLLWTTSKVFDSLLHLFTNLGAFFFSPLPDSCATLEFGSMSMCK